MHAGTAGPGVAPPTPWPWEPVNFTEESAVVNSTGELTVTNGTWPLTLGLSWESQVVLIVLYTLTAVVSMAGNSMVILVFTLGRRSRSDLRGFLINLACADLIMTLFCMPFTFTMTMLNNWIFSAPMCPVVLYMQTVSVTASVCTNMAIGIDRFWVVMYPLRSRITKSRSKTTIVIIWVIAFGLSSVQLVVGRTVPGVEVAPGVWTADCVEVWPEPRETWRTSYTFFILVLTYILPLVILSFTYGFVGCRLWQRTAPGNADVTRDMNQLRSKLKRRIIARTGSRIVLLSFTPRAPRGPSPGPA
ncbi:hypothetical protein NP493_209g03048 [Ridgeia piscesae]|uniref:G-protein coupled receptors family 1 profile domain-containing protein n=1 Tax=Ridgeia piscesae TaxID=27915 RepID=A0AAD9UEC3_RIDPI|nr:hypothetical protein NP493_209g03048 [Ridgeia piscesae]